PTRERSSRPTDPRTVFETHRPENGPGGSRRLDPPYYYGSDTLHRIVYQNRWARRNAATLPNPRNPRHTLTVHRANGSPWWQWVTTTGASTVTNTSRIISPTSPTTINVRPTKWFSSATGLGRHQSYWLWRSPRANPRE